MEADGLFDLEGMHAQGAEQCLVEIRDALEYYCLKFLRPWLEEYFYQKVREEAFFVLIRWLFYIFVLVLRGVLLEAGVGYSIVSSKPPQHCTY